jgi:hypothetical protein
MDAFSKTPLILGLRPPCAAYGLAFRRYAPELVPVLNIQKSLKGIPPAHQKPFRLKHQRPPASISVP